MLFFSHPVLLKWHRGFYNLTLSKLLTVSPVTSNNIDLEKKCKWKFLQVIMLVFASRSREEKECSLEFCGSESWYLFNICSLFQ